MSEKRSRKQTDPAPAKGTAGLGDAWIYAALAAAIAAIYARTAGYGFINYGDPLYVAANPRAAAGFTRDGFAWVFTSTDDSLWIPLTRLSHLIDCQLFGMQSGMHHLMSVLIHTASTLLLFAFLKRITQARWPSAFVAFVFAVHPLNVQTVAWIAERKEVLSGLFVMLTFWTYANYVEQRSPRRYAWVAGMLTCALLCDPLAATLPLLLLLLDFWPLKRWSTNVIRAKIPLIALALAARGVIPDSKPAFAAIPLGARIENALLSYAMYPVQMIAPLHLAVFYPFPRPVPLWQWTTAALAGVAVTVLVILGARARPWLMVGWLWYLAALLPLIGFVQIGEAAHADRFMYFSMIGLSIALAWGFGEFADRFKPAIAAAGGVACLAWAALGWINVEPWQNSMALFQHAIESTGGSAVAYNQLGKAQWQEGHLTEALANFENAVKIGPDDGPAQASLGSALADSGKADEGIGHLKRAVELRPDSAGIHADLAAALPGAGRLEEAIAEDRAALRLDARNEDARYGLGVALAEQRKTQEADPYLQASLADLTARTRLWPDDGEAHNRLGRVLELLGRKGEAIVEFSSAVRLRPDDAEAHENLGQSLFEQNRLDDAFGEFATAVRLRPGDALYLFRLATVLERLGKPLEALERTDQVLKLDPRLPGAQDMHDRLHLRVYRN